jgi:ornithine cyclodeaminase/alanine dehydrogenase-like protein (mu-crystallin family)
VTYAPLKALFLNRADIERVAPRHGEIVALVEQTYRWEAAGDAEVPAKIGVRPDRPNAFLHAMPAWVRGMGALGAKIVSYYPGNYEHGLQDSTAVILLYDGETGQPLSIMEGMWITFARTAACAAVAAKHLSRETPQCLGLVGCGGLGRWSLLMLAEVFPEIAEVRVASRTEASRKAFCEDMAGQGSWTLTPVDSVEDAVREADIVISSTPQQPEPRLKGEWWRPGTLAIPFDYPYAWDDAAVGRLDRLITDGPETIAQREKGFTAAGRPGLKLPQRRDGLADIVAGRAPGRASDDERILTFVTGIASTDVTVALEIYHRAVAAGAGVELAFD